MSEQKGLSETPEQVSGAAEQETTTVSTDSVGDKDTVKYDTYRRTLGEAKKYKAMVDELQGKLSSAEQAQLEAEGNKDKLIESLRNQNADLTKKYQGAIGSFASSRAKEAFVNEAVKLGCKSTKLLNKLVEEHLGSLSYDDEFNPDREQVLAVLSNIREEEPLLFGKDAPKVASHQLNPGGVKETEPKSLKNMDDAQLSEAFGRALLQKI